MKPATITGNVTPYKGNGRRLGYPTANVGTQTDLKEGVYFGYADLADYTDNPAIIFIGVPVTLGDTERRIEVHLLDIPDIDYYKQRLTVRIEHFHRTNKLFSTIEELLHAMREDEAEARAWFKKNLLAQ